MIRFLPAAALALGCALAAPALAQDGSAYGCRGLQTAPEMPVLEGRRGIFYRSELTMRMNHPLSRAAAGMVGQLSDLLAARGTRLIYIPVPTKSLAMPDALPEAAKDYGFDLETAEVAYDRFLGKLRDAGVTVVDSMRAMRGIDADPFIGTDFHWSPEGARAVAKATAQVIRDDPGYAGIDKTRYQTTAGEMTARPSPMRRKIQVQCRDGLPPAALRRYTTTPDAQGDASGGIFASGQTAPPISLVGTSMSAEPDFNFDGFLAEAAEAAVANYAITGGNQFGSLTSYLMTSDFRQNRPAYLVWENPIYNNLGEFGALPIEEFLAAAGSDCTPLDTSAPDPGVLAADLPEGALGRGDFLSADTGAANGREAVFHFLTAAGVDEQSFIRRDPPYAPTRWFIQYARPVWHPDTRRVRVELDRPAKPDATLSICHLKELPA